MGKIPEGMVKVGNRKIMKQGTSLVVAIPGNILEDVGVKRGDTLSLYNNGRGQLLIDLKPDEE